MSKRQQKVERCHAPGCDRVVQHKKSGLCHRCYQWLWYWQGKSPTDVMARVHQIEFWSKRFEMLMPANVEPLAKKTRRRRAG